MNCPSCGHQTQPGAKFCVQCGTTLTGASAPTAAAPRESAAPRAVPPAVPPIAPAHAGPPSVPRPVAATPTRAAGASSTQSVAPAMPAAISSPRRLALTAGVVAALIVLIVAGSMGYKALFGDDERAGRAEPSKGAPSVPAQSGDAAKEGSSAATPAPAQDSSVAQPAPATQGEQAKSGPATTANAAPPAAAQVPAASGAATGAASKSDAAPPARTATPVAPPGAPSKSAPAAPSPPTAQAGAQRAPAAPADRWEQMHQAMLRCGREEFMTRFVCEQRVGRQYCEGYWGTVPQCPGTPQHERGK